MPGGPTFTLAWTIFLEPRVPDPCCSHSKEEEFSVYPSTDSVCDLVVGWYVAPVIRAAVPLMGCLLCLARVMPS